MLGCARHHPFFAFFVFLNTLVTLIYDNTNRAQTPHNQKLHEFWVHTYGWDRDITQSKVSGQVKIEKKTLFFERKKTDAKLKAPPLNN